MIPGYNHNVKYKDRVYHVQTEDSGVANPHIITHLFVGGNIVESRKTAYGDLVGQASMKAAVVDLMQGQHKGMLKDLIGGRFDTKIAERSKNASSLNGPAPLNVDAGAQHRTSFGMQGGSSAPAPVAQSAEEDNAPTKPNPVIPNIPVPAPPVPEFPPLQTRPPAPIAAPRAPLPPPIAPATPPPRPVAPFPTANPIAMPSSATQPPAIPARQHAPGSAAAAFSGYAGPTHGAEPPTFATPPPINPGARPVTAGSRPLPPPAPIATAPTPARAEVPVKGVVLEADALARAFESKDENAVDSIFGEDLISEKSLDEVILSYLADDLSKT